MDMESTSIGEQERNGVAGAMPVYPGRYARFGAFQADLANGGLYQNGQRIKVQAKLFQALVVLLRRPGDIVTRDDVRRHLWPDTSLTNVDTNVYTTMNKLRQVLGDSSDNPLYIETIPRRGYTFTASVEFSDVRELPPVEHENNSVEPATQSDARRTLWSQKHIPTLLRASSLLFASMLLGALLVFIWFFAQSNKRPGHNLKQTASLSMRSGSGAIDLIAEVLLNGSSEVLPRRSR